jgi:hypothetical protein
MPEDEDGPQDCRPEQNNLDQSDSNPLQPEEQRGPEKIES